MNYEKLFNMQEQLDKDIREKKDLLGRDVLPEKLLALQVELGELANELPEVFKFWSTRKNNYEQALKEYVDGLHFILSIGLEVNAEQIVIDSEVSPDIEFLSEADMFLLVMGQVTSLYLESEPTTKQYLKLFAAFKQLGVILGFDENEIEEAYLSKNKVNFERQLTGY